MTMSQALSDLIVGPSMVIMGLSALAIIVGLIAAGRKQIHNKLQDTLTYGALIGMIIGLSGLLIVCLVNMVQILSQMQAIQ